MARGGSSLGAEAGGSPISAGFECSPQPVADDLLHYQEHYQDFFSELDILSTSPDRQQALFRVVSRSGSGRELRVRLTPSSFCVEEDSQDGSLRGEQFETFEQVLSAMDGAEAFGSRLCGLVSEQLAQQLGSFEGRFEDDDADEDGEEGRPQEPPESSRQPPQNP
uniref:GSKIP domain-containing protein n=1 Tax=Alexandrium andersonii TaxID=327968 RepID=A0A7S2BG52_9DINO